MKSTDKKQERPAEAVYNSLLFRGIDRKRTDIIYSRLKGTIKSYKKGELVICEEETLKDIGILLSGALYKVQVYDDGTEQMVQKLEKSYVVGLEIAVSIKKTSPYCLYAAENSEVYWFPVSCMEQDGILSDRDRIHLYRQSLRFLANEDIRKYKKIEILSARGARERIEKYLRIQMKRYNTSEFDIDFNREQLANYLGLNRSVLSHELKKMEKEGLLKVHKNHFIILN